MKIAIPYENGRIFQHFGHSENFKIYEVKDQKIQSAQVLSAAGSGHGALASLLKSWGVSVLICGGIGGGARTALSQAGIEIFPGADGDADKNAENYLQGKLLFDPDTLCDHHNGEEHNCGGSSCGEGHAHCGGQCGDHT